MSIVLTPKSSDVRIERAEITFSDERLAVPLRLSKGDIHEIIYVLVTLTLVTRGGKRAEGRGAILLSDVWAFPHATLDHAAKANAMRAICTQLAATLPTGDDFSDPLQKLPWLEETLVHAVAQVESEAGWETGTIPRLAALNCLSPFDAAIHDGWGRAIGTSVYQLYHAEWLNADLSHYLYGDLTTLYPGDYLGKRRAALRVQHVVGVGDALRPDPLQVPALPDLPTNLTHWIERDGLSSFKIKSKGQDPFIDAQRIAAVYATVVGAKEANNATGPIHLSLDPNEGCPNAAFLLEMLDALAKDAPAAYAALDYIEQPTGRDLDSYTFTLHEVAKRKPVILDESFDSLDVLPKLSAQGWSGIAVKTCKGQSASLIAYSWAKAHGYHITIQDLTNPGLALVHSANLCAHLDLAIDAFECNSRQYMSLSRPLEREAQPSYFATTEGQLWLTDEAGIGLY